jgi:hypothetical protein
MRDYAVFVLNFGHLNFEFVSDFDIRISDFLKSAALGWPGPRGRL